MTRTPDLKNIKILGPFWSAEAEAIQFAGPAADSENRGLRSIFVELINNNTEAKKDSEKLYWPQTVILLCFVKKVIINPVDNTTYIWQRARNNKPPQKPSLEKTIKGISDGELSLLLVVADAETGKDTFTCIAGDISLEVLTPQPVTNNETSRDLLYEVLNLQPKTENLKKESKFLAPLRVHASGLTIYGEIELPWEESPLTAHFQLNKILSDKSLKYHLTIEKNILITEERQAWITAWQNFAIFTKGYDFDDNDDEQNKTPYWVNLEVANSDIVAPVYWEINDWQSKESNLRFEQNSINLLLSEQNNTENSANSQARVALTLKSIKKKAGNLIDIDVAAGSNENSETVEKFSYCAQWQNNQLYQEFSFSQFKVAFNPTQLPQFLRERQDISSPEWFYQASLSNTDALKESDFNSLDSGDISDNLKSLLEKAKFTQLELGDKTEVIKKDKDKGKGEWWIIADNNNQTQSRNFYYLRKKTTDKEKEIQFLEISPVNQLEPNLIWAFMPLENGWAQLPIPNLSEQIYLDSQIANIPLTTTQDNQPKNAPLIQGVVTFNNYKTDIQKDNLNQEQPWSITISNALKLSGTWTLEKQSQPSENPYSLTKIELTLEKPEIFLDGFFWLSTEKPRLEDALPDLTNWVTGLESIPVQTLPVEKPIFPPLVILNIENLRFSKPDSTQKNLANLNEWSFEYQVDKEIFHQMVKYGVLPEDTFSRYLPLIWQRHPALPMIQALPLTQSKNPANYPSASRQLLPFELEVIETRIDSELFPKFMLPAHWRFGNNGASNWAKFLSDKVPNTAQEWNKLSDLPLASLSLPGVALYPHKNTQLLNIKYRFDLPYTDEINALAQLPKVPRNQDILSPLLNTKSPVPTKPLTRETFAEHWEKLSENASLASADATVGFTSEYNLQNNHQANPNITSLKNLIQPLNWNIQATYNLASYPGSLKLANADSSAELILEAEKALEGISGKFIEAEGVIKLTDNDANATYDFIAGSMAAYKNSDKDNIWDQRGLSRNNTQISTNNGHKVDKLLTTNVELAGKEAYELKTTKSALELHLHENQVWKIWFRDLPFKSGAFNRLESRSEFAQDINDPEARSREFNYLTGYEWRLVENSNAKENKLNNLPLQILSLHFYPLTLEYCSITKGRITGIHIFGRLQLPLQDSSELENYSNPVRIKFVLNQDTDKLTLDNIILESPPNQTSKVVIETTSEEVTETKGEWLLAIPNQTTTEIPWLEWKEISFDKQKQTINLAELKLHFFLLGSRWALKFPDSGDNSILSFSKDRIVINSINPEIPQFTKNDEIHLANVNLSLNLSEDKSYFIPQLESTLQINLGKTPSRRVTENLQLLYTFEEKNGNVVYERAKQLDDNLDLIIKNTDSIEWIENGGLSVNYPTIIKCENSANQLIEVCQKTNEITLEAWIKPSKEKQKSSRIITLSDGLQRRNFTMAQGVFNSKKIVNEYNVRLRQSKRIKFDILDGLPALQTQPGTVKRELTHLVYTRNKHGKAKIYLNGEEQETQEPIEIDGDFSNWDKNYFFALANELSENRPWIGEYYLVAVYNRALIQDEIIRNYRAGYRRPPSSLNAQLTLKLLDQLNANESYPNFQSISILSGLQLEPEQISTAVITENAINFQWNAFPEITNKPKQYLLPGMLLKPGESSGFAAITFSTHNKTDNGFNIPVFKIESAAVEALLFCQWNEFFQTSKTSKDANKKQTFGSSAGDLVFGYTGEQVGEKWQEFFLLNGFIEVKNLISWSTEMRVDKNETTLILPAARQEELPQLNHIRHTIRIMFNQHRILPEMLSTAIGNSLLFNLNKPWQFLAVVEQQLIEVKPKTNQQGSIEIIELGRDHRWTVVQEVRLMTPSAFKYLLEDASHQSTLSPNGEISPLKDFTEGYFGPLMETLDSELAKLTPNTLIVEASAPHWIRQTRHENTNPTNIQFLPNCTQQAILLNNIDEYAFFNPAKPEWLLLLTPFLGRLQADELDGLDKINPDSLLQVDNILLLEHYRRTLPLTEELPDLVLAFSHWADKDNLKIGNSGFDSVIRHKFFRLDPLSLEESWFRLQNPPKEVSSPSLQSITAALPDTPARLSRPTALKQAFNNLSNNSSNNLLLEQNPIYQTVTNRNASGIPPYGWAIIGLHIINSFADKSEATTQPSRYIAATLFRSPQTNNSNSTPVSFTISPYLGLGFKKPAQGKVQPQLVVGELLCLSSGKNANKTLKPVASHVWELKEDNEKKDDYISNLSESWAKETHALLCPDSPVAILRLRAIEKIEAVDSNNREVEVVTNYSFNVVEINTSTLSLKPTDPLRSPVSQLRFREAQLNLSPIPDNPQDFEIAPPQTKSVEPIYLLPNDTAVQNKNWSWGMSGLSLSVQYTEANKGIVGTSITSQRNGSGSNQPEITLWWQACQHFVQFRSATTNKSSTAGLPQLFRAPAIKSLLPVVPNLPLPPINEIDTSIKQINNSNKPNRNQQNSSQTWNSVQPVLPGEINYLLLGNRAGVMFAIRNQILRQSTSKSHGSQLLTSGSIPVQHRMPRPVILPKNKASEQDISSKIFLEYNSQALQTWASYFEPNKTVLATTTPTDEAFYGYEKGINTKSPRPARRLRMTLKHPECGAITYDWDGDFVFKFHSEPAIPETIIFEQWQIKIGISIAGQSFNYSLNPLTTIEVNDEAWITELNNLKIESGLLEKIKEGLNNLTNFKLRLLREGKKWLLTDQDTQEKYELIITQSENTKKLNIYYYQTYRFTIDNQNNKEAILQQILIQQPGKTFKVQARVSYHTKQESEVKQDFEQVLKFPLRVAGKTARPLALQPYFIHFEDPEYNRRLSSAPARVAKTLTIEKKEKVVEGEVEKEKKKLFLHTIILSTDRREYNPDSIISLRFDWDDNNDEFLKATKGKLEINKISAQGVKEETQKTPLKELDNELEIGALYQFSLQQFQTNNEFSINAGDTLELILTIEGLPDNQKFEEAVVLKLQIVEISILPVPQAAYALLRGYKNDNTSEVECVRFAWSPEPERIELISADDLLTEVVDRRAIFHWQDSVRIRENQPMYQVQKITYTGSTHFPDI